MARRLVQLIAFVTGLVVVGPTAAWACGGIVAPGNSGVLRKATTLAAWHDGYEHYVTGFQFASKSSSFGYIVPLPGVPTKIEKGGDWTLERLELEVNPPTREAAGDLALARPAASVEVLQQVRVDALDITVVRGGGPDVAAWAEEHGFELTADTPDVLAHYSNAGAVFALAKFDADAAADRGLIEGQGTVIHFTIPTPGPWIPLRILALGKPAAEVVEADLFILTDQPPAVSPGIAGMPGVTLRSIAAATESLLADLGSDRGMSWVPRSGMWLTALEMHSVAQTIAYDLSIDGGGPPRASITSAPQPVAPSGMAVWPWVAGGAGLVALFVLLLYAVPRRTRVPVA
jgi:hypothetical protein